MRMFGVVFDGGFASDLIDYFVTCFLPTSLE